MKVANLQDVVWLLHRKPAGPAPAMTYSKGTQDEGDLRLVRRVMAAYRLSFAAHQASASWWDVAMFDLKREIHDALIGDDVERAARLLRNPADTHLFWGFDPTVKPPAGLPAAHHVLLRKLTTEPDLDAINALWLFDLLDCVAVAVGARRSPHPEGGHPDADTPSTDGLLDRIEKCLGIPLSFPNPFPREPGLASRRGVVNFRALHALYQAWRIAQIAAGSADFKVMEIGAGLGRTAYFGSLFGIKNYTIVDIPLTNVAQAYFLGRALGFDAVTLYGERPGGPITILPSTALHGTYDLVVNADSWTEMSPEVAEGYWQFAKTATHAVLSINHEHNPFTVRSMYSRDPAVRATRHPYWPRRGYVEELITW